MQELGITHFFNLIFGSLFGWMMQLVGFHPTNPHAPIDDVFALEMLIAFGLIAFFIVVRLTLSVEKPNPAQQIAEMIHEFTGNQAESVIGHDYERFQAFVTCVLLFILLNNLIGLLIGFRGVTTPTGEVEVPLGIAVLTFLYYNFQGIRVHRFKYIKQFLGPIPLMSPLMFVIETISHLARMMSLTIRLYANMLASDLLTLICFSLIPFLAPSVFLGLHFAVALIQAYVFMLLSMIYIGMAVSHDH
ncbi:MAG: F0F1 ATP synthase subunit A [Terracidiphilus sp.]|jgi:F-type H+-transporting ATPase subunit a